MFPAPPVFTVRLARDGSKDVRDVIKNLAAAGKAYVEISPTGVLYALSDDASTKLLALIKPEHEKKSRADAAKKIGPATVEGDRGALHRAFRYYAYRYIELLWKSASEGRWGSTAMSTALDKYRDKSPFPGAWGVKYRGRRAWYNLLKGKGSPSTDHDRGADRRVGSSAEIDIVIK